MSAIARINEFEEWITSPPYERDISKWSNDETNHAWPGQYKDIAVQLAWEAWRASESRCRDEIEILQRAALTQQESHSQLWRAYHALEANALKLTTRPSLDFVATQTR